MKTAIRACLVNHAPTESQVADVERLALDWHKGPAALLPELVRARTNFDDARVALVVDFVANYKREDPSTCWHFNWRNGRCYLPERQRSGTAPACTHKDRCPADEGAGDHEDAESLGSHDSPDEVDEEDDDPREMDDFVVPAVKKLKQ